MRTCGYCKIGIIGNPEVCPACGHQILQKRHFYLIGILGAAIALALIGVAINNSDDSSPVPSAPSAADQAAQAAANAETEKDNVYFQFAVQGVKALRDEMRNPDSFKLSQAILMPDGAACYTYRAQNGFGGMNEGYFVLPPDGQGRTNEEDGFSSAWKKECVKQGGGTDRTWEVGYAAGLHGLFDKQ